MTFELLQIANKSLDTMNIKGNEVKLSERRRDMSNTAEKTRTATMGCSHQVANDYNTSCTRSAIPALAKEWMETEFGFWFERMTITPEIATEMLERKGQNRKIKPTVVSKYANDMSKNNWYFTPSAIWLDENGKLMDGQHRLSAVIAIGKPVDFIIVHGVPRSDSVDIHKQRTTADNLLFSGRISAAAADIDCTSTVNALLKLKVGGRRYNSLSDFDRERVLNKYEDKLVKAKGIVLSGKSHPIMRRADIRASILSALIIGFDEEFLNEFCRTVNTNLPSIANPNPALVLRRMLTDNGLNLTRIQTASITEQALMDCLNGKSRTKNYNPSITPPISSQLTAEEVLA